jgi:hypothetical protein
MLAVAATLLCVTGCKSTVAPSSLSNCGVGETPGTKACVKTSSLVFGKADEVGRAALADKLDGGVGEADYADSVPSALAIVSADAGVVINGDQGPQAGVALEVPNGTLLEGGRPVSRQVFFLSLDPGLTVSDGNGLGTNLPAFDASKGTPLHIRLAGTVTGTRAAPDTLPCVVTLFGLALQTDGGTEETTELARVRLLTFRDKDGTNAEQPFLIDTVVPMPSNRMALGFTLTQGDPGNSDACFTDSAAGPWTIFVEAM